MSAMTTLASPPSRHIRRTLNVVRMQFINSRTFVWVPLIILGASYLISYLIYAMIPGDAAKYGGGSQAPLWYFGAVGIQALTLTFPFSQAMSLTRREFYQGSLVAAAISAAALATVFVGLGLLERATDGWWVNGYFGYLPWVWDSGPAGAWFTYFVATMTAFIIGFWFATIYKRWGMVVVVVVIVGLVLALVLAAYVITRLGSWRTVWEALVSLGAVGLAAGLAMVAALLSVGCYLTLRRAIP